MKLTVTTLADDIFNIEVADDMELENFKALCEFESGIPTSQIALLWNGRPLHDDKKKLVNYGIKDGDMLLIQRIHPGHAGGAPASGNLPTIDFGSIPVPGSSNQPVHPSSNTQQAGLSDDPATLREMLLASPHDLALLKERNPPLADALLSGSLEKFTEVLKKQQEEKADRERERICLLGADPFDPEAQQKIAEEIRLKNVEMNMETAMEYAPESFGQVVMLYVDCVVNGHAVKAFVDSGAQMTIMSQACAERCNIMRLVDRRWAGVAKGVGTQKIIGRVHLCQIQIGENFLQSSFSILEEQPMDMLLGLDMLKRHQCCIDLKRNVLVIGTTGQETPFLTEAQLPSHARLNRSMSESMQVDEDKQLAEALAKSAEEAGNPKTSTSAFSQGASSQSQQQVQNQNVNSASVEKLVSQGFPRSQVIEELQRSNGNIDLALMALIARSISLPESS
ncbi:hypothetical protein LSH36_188g08013 [Paralvinella palmiformis]|uniref:Uncharacterized protein n=1 Tax=Paralvinella palmiformis TaxID=53620 RepID=A0AAD9N5K9_9ANNE|nr:hypothetical protein LSH36_188g08013 [Paralvinella palmiformis]